jgi:DNA repair exonuclease SbcCD nuclease subunit
MKILFYTDIHLSGVAPRHRTDDFPKALITKLRETYAIAESEACDFIAFGGDFFNTHRIFNYDIISDSLDIIGGSPQETYACVGEHDLYGHSPETYPTSTLAFFERICLKLHIIREPIEVGNVTLYAKHEWDNIHEAMKQKVDKKKLNILICHELITNRRAAFDIVDTALLKSPFDLVLSGDLHDGYDPHEVNGTWYCNPGSLARRTTADAGRWPQIAIIEIEKGFAPVIELRRLACGKSGEEVFGESLAEVARSAEEFNGNVFAEEMMEFEAESVDVHELIQKVGAKKGLRKEVLDYLATKKVREGDAGSV